MVDRATLDRRLAKLEELVRRLAKLAVVDRAAFLRDEGLQAQAERWLHLAGECALDLAHHLIAERGWKTPATYREAFEILGQEQVISETLAGQMANWAALRNVLVHLYLDVDHEILREILTRDLDQLRQYAAAIDQAARADEDP